MPLRATLGAWRRREAVKNNVEYIYLKDDEVAKKKADMLTIQATIWLTIRRV